MKSQIALAAFLAAIPAAAGAQTGQGNVGVDGSVAGRCVLGPPSLSSVALGTLLNTSGPRVGRLALLAGRSINFPGSWCNFANTRVTVSASALIASDTAVPMPGYARAVNFTTTVANWAAANAQVTTLATVSGATPSASAPGGTHPTPKLADLMLTVSDFSVPADSLLVTGSYAGNVTITLGPAS